MTVWLGVGKRIFMSLGERNMFSATKPFLNYSNRILKLQTGRSHSTRRWRSR